MFSASKNGFEGILCPADKSCRLPNCLFRHSDNGVSSASDGAASAERATKRRKLDDSTIVSHPSLNSRALHSAAASTSIGPASHPSTRTLLATGTQAIRPSAPPTTVQTPPKQSVSTSQPFKGQRTSQGFLTPLPLQIQPAGYGQRYLYLSKLVESMQRLNEQAKSSADSKMQQHVLNEDNLIQMALKQEAKIATDSPSVYPNMLKSQLLAYKRMTIVDWVKLVIDASGPPNASNKASARPKRPYDEELNERLKLEVLRRMVIRQQGLEPFGYVTSLPTDEDLEAAASVEASIAGYETCTRCDTRFQIFPDRREDGALASGGQCEYHWGRPIFRKGAEKVYRCCNGLVGQTPGCSTSSSHTFELKDVGRQARLLQFACTPANDTVPDNLAVAMDCEMGFTTRGNELIRLTALRWPSGEVLHDFLVRPMGAVLDFNTRFSGVTPQAFALAKPYDTTGGETVSGDALRIVESPQQARHILFKSIKPTTILIGHAIENDLRAMRIVHPTLVDTAILCPHPRAKLPARRALRDLAQQYLERTIQVAGAAGHDSHEDAKATADVVEELAKMRYNDLRRSGWTVVQDRLVSPSKQS